MKDTTSRRQLLLYFAGLLEYPRSGIVRTAQACRTLTAEVSPEAATQLSTFVRFAESVPLGRLEEAYSSTFDLEATYHPYIGYHLLGETYRRSAFMVRLKEHFAAHGFEPPAHELPDHLAVVLRFLGVCDDEQLVRETIAEGILPALDGMLGGRKGKGHHAGHMVLEPRLEGGGAPLPALPEEEAALPRHDPETQQNTSHGASPTAAYRAVLRALQLVLHALGEKESTVFHRRSPMVQENVK